MITRDKLMEFLRDARYHEEPLYIIADRILKELQPGPFPNGDAEDPPVHQLALDTARKCFGISSMTQTKGLRINQMQIAIRETIFAALDRCEQLGGRSKR